MFVVIFAIIASMVLLHCTNSNFTFDIWHVTLFYTILMFVQQIVLNPSQIFYRHIGRRDVCFLFNILELDGTPVVFYLYRTTSANCIAAQGEACVYSGTRGQLTELANVAGQLRKTASMFTSRTIMSVNLENRNRI